MAKKEKNELVVSGLGELTNEEKANQMIQNELKEVQTSGKGKLQMNEDGKKEGDWVFGAFDMSKTHRNVAERWAKQCIDWETLISKLEENEALNQDCYVRLGDLKLDVENGKLVFDVERAENKDGKEIELGATDGKYCLSDNARFQATGPGYMGLGERMLTVGQNDVERGLIRELYLERWRKYVANEGGRKTLYMRLRNNGEHSVRAILSEQYFSVGHLWIAKVLQQVLGDKTLVSHFDERRFLDSGGDYVRYNALIADEVRHEKDSDFGGMISVGNGEVGNARFSLLPSIFRSICINGMVWGNRSDKKYKVSGVHKGSKNLEELAVEITSKINTAIPLVMPAIENLMKLKELTIGSDGKNPFAVPSVLSVIAGKGMLGLNKTETKDLILEFKNQENQNMQGNNAYSVINCLTSFAQTQSTLQGQQLIEEYAGGLMREWQANGRKWETLVRRAGDVEDKVIETMFSNAS